MESTLRGPFLDELASARRAEDTLDLARAWRHLERAHVLSQGHAGPHVRVHGRMLGFAVRRGDLREALLQLPRLILAAPGSILGRAPSGNTGGGNVGMFTPMAIPPDLQAILDGPPAR